MEQEWQMVEAGMVATWGFTTLPLTFVKINVKVLLCAQRKFFLVGNPKKACRQSMTRMEPSKGFGHKVTELCCRMQINRSRLI